MENFNSPLIGQLSQSNPALAGFFVYGSGKFSCTIKIIMIMKEI